MLVWPVLETSNGDFPSMFIEKHLENGNYSDQLLWYTQMYLMLSVCGPCTMKPDLSWIKYFHFAVQKNLNETVYTK